MLWFAVSPLSPSRTMPVPEYPGPMDVFFKVMREDQELVINWLHCYGFDERTADIYRKPRTPEQRLSRAVQAVAAEIQDIYWNATPPPEGVGLVEFIIGHVNYERLVARRFERR
jgi:hypothetical protein